MKEYQVSDLRTGRRYKLNARGALVVWTFQGTAAARKPGEKPVNLLVFEHHCDLTGDTVVRYIPYKSFPVLAEEVE